jgi:hypothetical protein
MTAYQRLRRFVDRDLGRQAGRPGTFVVVIAVLPFFGVPLIGSWWWIPSLLFLAVWLGFVAYRLWWVLRTGLIDADRRDWVEPT